MAGRCNRGARLSPICCKGGSKHLSDAAPACRRPIPIAVEAVTIVKVACGRCEMTYAMTGQQNRPRRLRRPDCGEGGGERESNATTLGDRAPPQRSSYILFDQFVRPLAHFPPWRRRKEAAMSKLLDSVLPGRAAPQESHLDGRGTRNRTLAMIVALHLLTSAAGLRHQTGYRRSHRRRVGWRCRVDRGPWQHGCSRRRQRHRCGDRRCDR